MATYAHPETLVSTDWAAAHATDDNVRIVEVDVDTKAYDEGHVPGAIAWAWNSQLCDTVRRDILSKQQFEELMSASGITPATTLVIYGDNNNWFAAWAFWQAKIYGHRDVRLMNGGRKKWLAEGRELATGTPHVARAHYQAAEPDLSLRAFLPQVQQAVAAHAAGLVDVRSPQEFSGEILAPPGLPETCQRGGHIPGARSIPWGKACNDDGTFKTADELRALYAAEGIDGSRPVIAYCRIGERSSHSWFVLKYLLGYGNVTQLRRLLDRMGQPGRCAGRKRRRRGRRQSIACRRPTGQATHSDFHARRKIRVIGSPFPRFAYGRAGANRRPGVTALAILSLGFAIGFCTVGFSLLDAGWLRDLPLRQPAQMHWLVARDREQRIANLTWIEYQALASRGRVWEGVLAECREGPKVRLPDRDDFPITAGVSANYSDLLGVKAAAGDVFHAGGGSDGIVVITDHYGAPRWAAICMAILV